jgi:hypothetical protein
MKTKRLIKKMEAKLFESLKKKLKNEFRKIENGPKKRDRPKLKTITIGERDHEDAASDVGGDRRKGK